MPGRTLLHTVVAGGLCLACGGCWLEERLLSKRADEPEARKVPPEVEGTVGEYASLVRGGSLLLDGHGLIVGLGKNGSSEVPPRLKKYLVEYMLKQKVGSALADAGGITPSQMIADKDTAVVRLVAVVPPGAPKGWTFDVRVSALSRTGTRSLEGGILYPFPLYLPTGEDVPPSSGARAWAQAEGPVFLNPFLDPNRPADAPRLREGRLIGGGKVLESRPLRLILREPDYARCNLIQRRLNQRFGQQQRIANATNPSTIELKIPLSYQDDYQHFLELLMHLPLQAGPGRWESRAKEVAEAMRQVGANHDGLSLVWEAMGNQVVGVCRGLYAAKSPAAAFYSARAGVRMRDRMAGDVLIRLAETAGSPFQVPAIRELGRQQWLVRSVPALRRRVEDASELVRIAAYEALVELGDNSLITRVEVGEKFTLDLVTSRRSYVIYATQSGEQKIVLFGKDMAVAGKVFFDVPGLVTIADTMQKVEGKEAPQRKLMVFRTIPRTGGISAPFYTDFLVRSLIETLGRPARRGLDGKIEGLELTYGQIAAVLYRMCEVDRDIPARFVLQPPPGRERIYRGTPTVGRPDMPGD
jgi:hypothetical protein